MATIHFSCPIQMQISRITWVLRRPILTKSYRDPSLARYQKWPRVIKSIFSVPIFCNFFAILDTPLTYWISLSYLAGVAAETVIYGSDWKNQTGRYVGKIENGLRTPHPRAGLINPNIDAYRCSRKKCGTHTANRFWERSSGTRVRDFRHPGGVCAIECTDTWPIHRMPGGVSIWTLQVNAMPCACVWPVEVTIPAAWGIHSPTEVCKMDNTRGN